jgi:hypothetical protein
MSLAILNTLDERKQQRIAAAEADFKSLVRQIADGGDEPAVDRVEQVLAVLGKDVKDLSAAVNLYLRRREMWQQVEPLSRHATELAEIEAKIRAANAKLIAAQEEHKHTFLPLRWRREQITQESLQGGLLKQELRKTCPDPKLVDRWDTIQSKRARLYQRAGELREVIAFRPEAERNVKAGTVVKNGVATDWTAIGKKQLAAADAAAAELEDVERQIAAAEAAEKEIGELMLEP